MSDPLDMTGMWFGRYAYPAATGMPPVSFIANLDDAGGALSGTITEPNTFGGGVVSELRAIVSGHRDGDHVDFSKCYDGADVAAHAVEYSGTLGDEGTRLSGSWLLEPMIGSFEMRRTRPGTEEDVAQQETVMVGGQE